MKDLADLRIYQLAVECAEENWEEVSTWDKFTKWTVGKQIVDSADDIAAIPEGSGKAITDSRLKNRPNSSATL
ncbi:MAG: hypothetical protein ACE5JB_15145 [bacterium]